MNSIDFVLYTQLETMFVEVVKVMGRKNKKNPG